MRFGHGLHDRQPQAGAALVAAGGDEATEEPVLDVALDCALVAHGEHDVFTPPHDFHEHRRRRLRVQERVVDQVG